MDTITIRGIARESINWSIGLSVLMMILGLLSTMSQSSLTLCCSF